MNLSSTFKKNQILVMTCVTVSNNLYKQKKPTCNTNMEKSICWIEWGVQKKKNVMVVYQCLTGVFLSVFLFKQVSIVLAYEATWEKRLNLYKREFYELRKEAAIIIQHYDRIQRLCDDGVPYPTPYNYELDNSGRVGITVTVYQGFPKIHIGTAAYCTEVYSRTLERMSGGSSGGAFKKVLPSGGHVIPVGVFHHILGEAGDKACIALNLALWTWRLVTMSKMNC